MASLYTSHTYLPCSPSDTLLIWTSIHLPLAWMAWMAWTLAAGSSRRRNGIHDMHAAVCGLLTSIGLSEGATILLKFYVQRRRPNFYALCGWSSELLKCTASTQKIREASFSFPSGHSSLSSCAMVYLAWFCLSKVVAARGPRWLALVSCVLPVSWAFLVGASRLADHWHHPSDVIAGLVLGSVCATVAFHTWYPPVWSAPQLVGLPWSLHNTDIAKLPSFLE
jgi:membrane-associated phospholipid phosphatase